MIINFVSGVEADFVQQLGTMIGQHEDSNGFVQFFIYEYNGEIWYLE